LPKQGFFQSIWEGLKTSIKTVGIIFVSLADLIVGIFTDISVIEKFVGPVGIVNVAIQTTKLGVVHFAQLVALISLNLAVFNIIPIPALDGGRLFFLLIEKLKGSPINAKMEMAVNGIGFLFLIFLILAITVKDILTLF
jgi:regulator of sigma E protease